MKNKSSKILECIPNFSEGQNEMTIHEIQNSIARVTGVKILHIDIGHSANRTVFTIAGNPESVVEAAFQGAKTASELIDMQNHKGIHPRIGATDVIPLVPVSGISMKETIQLSYHLASRIGTELGIPVYCYERSALTPKCKKLENIRKGEYEGLKERLSSNDWRPDFGPCSFNLKSGATIVGARNFLVAYNVNLDTGSVEVANKIAARIRTSGKVIYKNGIKKRTNGLLKSVKAIGWYIDEYKKAQVSMNLTDIKKTPMHVAYETIKEAAGNLGVKVTGSELIGLVPEKALMDAGIYYASSLKSFDVKNKDSLIKLAVEKMGLNELKPFNQEIRVIEYLL
jgi:glutamate formiminotransferase / formiminotetrahydrofolate cyclodeaminase